MEKVELMKAELDELEEVKEVELMMVKMSEIVEVDKRGGEGREAGEGGGHGDDQNQNLNLDMNQNHGQNQETAEPGQTGVNLFKLDPRLTCRTASSALVLRLEAPPPTILLASLVAETALLG